MVYVRCRWISRLFKLIYPCYLLFSCHPHCLAILIIERAFKWPHNHIRCLRVTKIGSIVKQANHIPRRQFKADFPSTSQLHSMYCFQNVWETLDTGLDFDAFHLDRIPPHVQWQGDRGNEFRFTSTSAAPNSSYLHIYVHTYIYLSSTLPYICTVVASGFSDSGPLPCRLPQIQGIWFVRFV